MAGLTFVTAEMTIPLSNKLQLFALILIAPPVALLAIGAALRWFVEGVLRRTKISEC
jgi:hypothetical protein